MLLLLQLDNSFYDRYRARRIGLVRSSWGG